jgi:hypothetical protein
MLETVRANLDPDEVLRASNLVRRASEALDQYAYVRAKEQLLNFFLTVRDLDLAFQGRRPSWNESSHGYYDLNAGLVFALEAFRMFLNHSEVSLKREYGEHSVQWETWRRCKSELFDQWWSYRFLSGLRNYQHVADPIQRVVVEGRLLDDGSIHSELIVRFDRDTLLGNFVKWRADVKSELALQSGEFDALALVAELDQHLDHLMQVLVEIQTAELVADLDLLDSLVRECDAHMQGRNVGFEPYLVLDETATPDGLTFDSLWLRSVDSDVLRRGVEGRATVRVKESILRQYRIEGAQAVASGVEPAPTADS